MVEGLLRGEQRDKVRDVEPADREPSVDRGAAHERGGRRLAGADRTEEQEALAAVSVVTDLAGVLAERVRGPALLPLGRGVLGWDPGAAQLGADLTTAQAPRTCRRERRLFAPHFLHAGQKIGRSHPSRLVGPRS